MQFLHTHRLVVQLRTLLPILVSVIFRLTGPAEASSFLVSWDPPASAPDGSLDYYVYVSTVPGSFDDNERIFVDEGESVVIDVPCEAETTYYFAVQSVDAAGYTSSLSTPHQPLLTTGPGPGWSSSDTARLYSFDESSTELCSFTAFDSATETRGLKVACGDVLGLGDDQVIVAPGPGCHGPEIRVFHADGTPVGNGSFLAFPYSTSGASVCCGDLDGDGYDEIITGPGPALYCGSDVRIFEVDGSATLLAGPTFRAFPMPHFGVQVAAADVDNDCFDEVITAPGPSPNYPGVVRWFSLATGEAEFRGQLDAFAGTADNAYGANLAVGMLTP